MENVAKRYECYYCENKTFLKSCKDCKKPVCKVHYSVIHRGNVNYPKIKYYCHECYPDAKVRNKQADTFSCICFVSVFIILIIWLFSFN